MAVGSNFFDRKRWTSLLRFLLFAISKYFLTVLLPTADIVATSSLMYLSLSLGMTFSKMHVHVHVLKMISMMQSLLEMTPLRSSFTFHHG